MRFSIIEQTEDLTRVALIGSLDLAGVQEIDAEFRELVATVSRALVLDISEVDYVASIGMAMLLETRNSLKARDASIVLVNPQPALERTLRTLKLDTVIPITHGPDVPGRAGFTTENTEGHRGPQR